MHAAARNLVTASKATSNIFAREVAMRKTMQGIATGALVCMLMGCSTLHLHNSAADAAATSAKADYDASKITESIKLGRAIFDSLDTKEIEAFRSLTEAERNTTLLSLLSDSGNASQRVVGNGFVSRINYFVNLRLQELTGISAYPVVLTSNITLAVQAESDAAGAEQRAREQLVDRSSAFASMPACSADVSALKDSNDLSKAVALLEMPDLKPKHAGLVPSWISEIQKLGKACTKLIEAREALNKLKSQAGGQLQNAQKKSAEQDRLLKHSQDQAKTATVRLRTAIKALADAQKAAKESQVIDDLTCDLSKPVPAVAPEATDAPAKKNELCKALADLQQLEDFGIKVLSEERLAKINAILAALSGATPPTAEEKAALEPGLILLSTSKRLSHAWTQYRKSGDKKFPALEPLLIDKGITTAQLEYAKSGVKLAESRVMYAKAYEEATIQEVRMLAKAKAEIASLGVPPAPDTPCNSATPTVFCASVSDVLSDKKFDKSLANGGERVSRRVYRALAHLSESYSVARNAQLEAELHLIDTEYRVALSRSEASLASWHTLLSVPVDQLKTYHAGGIKPLEAATLTAQVVQALAAVGIAVRIK